MKARECVRFQKMYFQPHRSNRRADFAPNGPREVKTAERLSRSARLGFGFVVKMYGLNVAQGSEQYIPQSEICPPLRLTRKRVLM
jgi:hypothetical protein